ncbi:MAG: DUF2961 domain-containing protein [Candidatus Hydrogenedentes bacterium]|nr:DUF2961 domain-containing protein [Candidatus Hydrogenedentota bacterium]
MTGRRLRATGVVLALALSAGARGLPFEAELGLPDGGQAGRVTQLMGVGPGATETLMDLAGPACITHIWMTTAKNDYRRIVLRMYWDGESEPSVEAPLADFFGVGHNHRAPERPFATACLAVAPNNGYNCYFPMPFRHAARVTVTNEQEQAVNGAVYFQADYRTFDGLPDEVPYFHAQWRRESPALRRARPYSIIEATGRGFIAGMTYHLREDDAADAWYHGGGDVVFLDAGARPRCLNGIGGEDYFGAAWGIAPFVSPYTGCTHQADGQLSMYRFYLEGPIRFEESARLAFGAMANEITSVGYWYQVEPHHRFCRLPAAELRDPEAPLEPGSHAEELLPGRQLNVAVIGPFAGGLDTGLPPDGGVDLGHPAGTNFTGPYKLDHPGEDDRQVRWERARTTLGWLDLAALYKPKMAGPRCVQQMSGAVAYVCVRVRAEAACPCRFLLGHDDPVRVSVNGEPIGDLDRQAGFQGEDVVLPLRAGWNDVVLKVANTGNENWGAFAISLSFADADGLEFDAFSELPAAPELARAPSETP